jgi:Tol biopolymer transport system component
MPCDKTRKSIVSAAILCVMVCTVFALSLPQTRAAIPGVNGKIAFASERDGNSEIYLMDADGIGQTRLTNSSAFDGAPAWSPDGSKIAFVSNRDGNEEIYIMNADGSSQSRLTNTAAPDSAPAWSPDGSKIAFTSLRDGNEEIYVMNADGSSQANLSNQPAAAEREPNWSPDGSKIAFVSSRDGNFEIYVMNADGSGQTRLTSNAAAEGGPNWSPDGTRIAFETNRDGNFEVYVMSTDGSGQTRLTNNPAQDAQPNWQSLPLGSPTSPPPTETAEATAETMEGLRALVTECVTDHGVQNSLLVKLDHGQLEAFMNEVQAQLGKKITTQCTDEMVQMATALRGNP